MRQASILWWWIISSFIIRNDSCYVIASRPCNTFKKYLTKWDFSNMHFNINMFKEPPIWVFDILRLSDKKLERESSFGKIVFASICIYRMFVKHAAIIQIVAHWFMPTIFIMVSLQNSNPMYIYILNVFREIYTKRFINHVSWYIVI